MELSIVVPAYNEGSRIGKTLVRILDFLRARQWTYEIIVIDDGSSDTTAATTAVFADQDVRLISNKTNRGKGYSVRRGVFEAQYSNILMSDADLSTPIEEAEKLIAHEQQYDVVIGSRALKDSRVEIHQPWHREYGGKLFNLFVRALAVRGIADTQCGFKLFKKEAARAIFSRQTVERWGFDVEALYVARKLGYKIKEVPVVWRNDSGTKVRFVRDATRMLFDLLKIRWNDIRGVYSKAAP
jgi:dolichyl-phosphate beta-glucosyltransferase